MIRDIDFSVPTREAADELIALCEKAGWTVDREKDVFRYEKGVPFSYGDGFEDYIPETTYTSVIAHKAGFDYDELSEIYAKADEIAGQVTGAEVTGGGTAFGDDEAVKVEDAAELMAQEMAPRDVIPFVEDAQPIVDYIVSQVGFEAGGMRDQAMEIRKLLVEAGWTPPPRVFLEGDEIPCHLPVIDNYGEVNSDHTDYEESDEETYTANYDVVEFNVQWAAAVQRERERRGVPNPRAHLADEED